MPTAQWARDAGGEKHILHIHGPKLDKVECILNYMDKRSNSNTPFWEETVKKQGLEKCGMGHHQSEAMMSILQAAYITDKGQMYRTTQSLYSKYLGLANLTIRRGPTRLKQKSGRVDLAGTSDKR